MIATTLTRQIERAHVAEVYQADAESQLNAAIANYLEHFSLWDLQKALIAQLSKLTLPSGRSQRTNVSFQDCATGEYL